MTSNIVYLQPRKSTFLYSHMLNSDLIFSVDIIRDRKTALKTCTTHLTLSMYKEYNFLYVFHQTNITFLYSHIRPLEILRKQEKWFIERSNLIIFSSVYLFI
ncbi:hypothetical protein ACJX0J_019670, partial [Zea mays]